MKRAARVDANQVDLVSALRALGCSVQSLAGMGDGVPDLLVGYGARNVLLEVKDGEKVESRRRLTKDEADWIGGWRGQVAVVKSLEEALAVLGRLEATRPLRVTR